MGLLRSSRSCFSISYLCKPSNKVVVIKSEVVLDKNHVIDISPCCVALAAFCIYYFRRRRPHFTVNKISSKSGNSYTYLVRLLGNKGIWKWPLLELIFFIVCTWLCGSQQQPAAFQLNRICPSKSSYLSKSEKSPHKNKTFWNENDPHFLILYRLGCHDLAFFYSNE